MSFIDKYLKCTDIFDNEEGSGHKVMLLSVSREADPVDRDDVSEKSFISETKEALEDRECIVETINADELQSMWDDRFFDLIIMKEVLQCQKDRFFGPKKLLALLKKHLTAEGRIICIEKNRMGLSLLSGLPQNPYRPVEPVRFDEKGPGFLRSELTDIFRSVKFADFCFRYPFPDLEGVEEFYSDLLLPDESATPPHLSAVIREGVFKNFADHFVVETVNTDFGNKVCIYSSTRDRRSHNYEAVRRVYRMADGREYEKETADTPEGREYLRRKLAYMQKYSDYYNGFSFAVNPWEAEDDCSILTPHLHGETLEDILDERVRDEDFEGFYIRLRRYVDAILSPEGLKIHDPDDLKSRKFSAWGGFVRFFGPLDEGEEELLKDEQAPEVAHMGIRFSDVFVEGRGWTIASPDFIEDFPVPFTYLLYYPLEEYFDRRSWRPEEWKSKLYERFGITEEKQRVYRRMRGMFKKEVYSEKDEESEEGFFRIRTEVKKGERFVTFSLGGGPGILEVFDVQSERGKSLERYLFIDSKIRIGNKYYFASGDAEVKVDSSRAKKWVEISYNYLPMPLDIKDDMESLIEIVSGKAYADPPKTRKRLFGL